MKEEFSSNSEKGDNLRDTVFDIVSAASIKCHNKQIQLTACCKPLSGSCYSGLFVGMPTAQVKLHKYVVLTTHRGYCPKGGWSWWDLTHEKEKSSCLTITSTLMS